MQVPRSEVMLKPEDSAINMSRQMISMAPGADETVKMDRARPQQPNVMYRNESEILELGQPLAS